MGRYSWRFLAEEYTVVGKHKIRKTADCHFHAPRRSGIISLKLVVSRTLGTAMNCRFFVLCTLFLLPFLVSPLRAQTYSIREVGFVDVETKPYRLIVMSKDLDESAVAKQKK